MLPFALLYAGLTALALAMSTHRRAAFRSPLTPRFVWLLRAVGLALLAGATVAWIQTHGWGRGLVALVAFAAAAGFALTLLLAFAPRRAGTASLALLALGLLHWSLR